MGCGLIPACAGKTNRRTLSSPTRRSHPRVCGENADTGVAPRSWEGSSPRVRGKQIPRSSPEALRRLIPACAGKTQMLGDGLCEFKAHPRVCGENDVLKSRVYSQCGSSPRVRGKQHPSVYFPSLFRLIPACAGKTRTLFLSSMDPRAHPRVCGENSALEDAHAGGQGSSPRVRGKLLAGHTAMALQRLIPACAGKTSEGRSSLLSSSAHPRVCGENKVGEKRARSEPGSSPRVRGKRSLSHADTGIPGLIPACAGKTARLPCLRDAATAHPRVCGENANYRRPCL